jgi:hypothetical protein
MNKPNRPNLAELLAESARKAQEKDSFDAQVKRISDAVRAELSHNHKAETSKSLACPSCGAPLPESWCTDDVTSVSDDNDDDVNEQDDDDDDRELDAKAESNVVAELLARKRRRSTFQIARVWRAGKSCNKGLALVIGR